MKRRVQYQLGKLLAGCAESRSSCVKSAQGKLEAAALSPRWNLSPAALLDEFAALPASSRGLYFISRSFEPNSTSLAVDATQTVSYPYNTGIQRVTREILRPLGALGMDVVPFKHLNETHIAVALEPLERNFLYDFHRRRSVFRGLGAMLLSAIRKPLRSLFLQIVSVFVDDVESRHELERGFEDHSSKAPGRGLLISLTRWLFSERQLVTHGLRMLIAEVVLTQTRLNYYRARTQGWSKIFFILHDLLPLEQPEYFGADPLYNDFVGLVNSCSGIVCESETTQKSFERWIRSFGAGSHVQIARAYLASSFEQTKSAVRKAAVVRGICVGTFEPRKNQIGVLLATARLRKVGVPVHITFVGNPGWKSSDFFAAKAALDPRGEFSSVKIALNDSQLRDEYLKADFFIQASFGEGFGLPALEGLSLGKPGIVSRGGSLSEISRECGGCLECEPDQPNAIETALREIVKPEIRSKLTSEIHNVDVFSWTNFAKAIENLIQAVG